MKEGKKEGGRKKGGRGEAGNSKEGRKEERRREGGEGRKKRGRVHIYSRWPQMQHDILAHECEGYCWPCFLTTAQST